MEFEILKEWSWEHNSELGNSGSFGNEDVGKYFPFEVKSPEGQLIEFEFYCGMLATSAQAITDDVLRPLMLAEMDEVVKSAPTYQKYCYSYEDGKFHLMTYVMFHR